MAQKNHALIAPVGEVWAEVRKQYPSIDLYEDEVHPNTMGTYLAACTLLGYFLKTIQVMQSSEWN